MRAVARGRVQGVGFRYFILDRARELGLDGWVRNVGSQEVEVVAEGPRQALEQLVEAMRRGPRLAWVEGVSVQYEPSQGDLHGFRIEPSAW